MIFVSYASEDRQFIKLIAEAIKFRTHFDIWMDTQIRAGTPYTSSIQQALDQCKVVVVFWSKHSIRSNFVIAEATSAQKAGKLVPVRIDKCDIPPPFNILHTLDVFEVPEIPYAGNRGLDQLIFEITKRTGELADLLCPTLSKEESEEYELLRRVASGLKVFTVFANRENLIFVPLQRYFSIVGFRLLGGIEPEEMSGQEVCPMLDELQDSDIVLFGILPSMLTRPAYVDLIFEKCGQKPTFVLLLGSVDMSDVVSRYPSMSEIDKENFIIRRDLDFRLEGNGAKDAWELVRKIVSSVSEA